MATGLGESVGLVESQPQTTAMAQMASSRAAQQVQAAVVVAKKFPRDEDASAARIIKACKRRTLAEVACYEYTKGGQKIEGPSIRLAEVLAQNWGNVDFGFTELERRKVQGVGVSTVEAYCWDMETNTRRAVTFEVKHWRDRKGGGYPLEDEREIYELMANQAARRMRACILAIIPGDIQDAAVEECGKTLAGNNKEPLTDRVRQMLVKFDEFGVSKDDIERKLGHNTSAITEQELARLGKAYNSLRDGMGSKDELFPPEVSTAPPSAKPTDLASMAKGAKSTNPPAETPKAKEPPKTESPTTAAKSDASPMDAYATELHQTATVAEAGKVYDAWFGPDATQAWSGDEHAEGARYFELHKKALRATK